MTRCSLSYLNMIAKSQDLYTSLTSITNKIISLNISNEADFVRLTIHNKIFLYISYIFPGCDPVSSLRSTRWWQKRRVTSFCPALLHVRHSFRS